MEATFAEMPLALFTTLAPLGAGAFIALAIAFSKSVVSEGGYVKLDKMSLVPAAFVLVGMVAAFFHLANPAAAFGVFAGLGSSPLSNELACFVIVLIAVIGYVALALAGKMTEGLRKAYAIVLAALAVIFGIVSGMAYAIETIPSWSAPATILQMVGFALLGGAALGAWLLDVSVGEGKLGESGTSKLLVGVSVAGLVAAVAGLAMMVATVSGMSTPSALGSDLVSGAMIPLIVAVAGLVAAVGLMVLAFKRKDSGKLLLASTALAIVGIFAARLVFYALEMSVGLMF